MDIVNKKITVKIIKITLSKDGLIYVSIHHPFAKNIPSFVFDKTSLEKLKDLISANYEKEQ